MFDPIEIVSSGVGSKIFVGGVELRYVEKISVAVGNDGFSRVSVVIVGPVEMTAVEQLKDVKSKYA